MISRLNISKTVNPAQCWCSSRMPDARFIDSFQWSFGRIKGEADTTYLWEEEAPFTGQGIEICWMLMQKKVMYIVVSDSSKNQVLNSFWNGRFQRILSGLPICCKDSSWSTLKGRWLPDCTQFHTPPLSKSVWAGETVSAVPFLPGIFKIHQQRVPTWCLWSRGQCFPSNMLSCHNCEWIIAFIDIKESKCSGLGLFSTSVNQDLFLHACHWVMTNIINWLQQHTKKIDRKMDPYIHLQ